MIVLATMALSDLLVFFLNHVEYRLAAFCTLGASFTGYSTSPPMFCIDKCCADVFVGLFFTVLFFITQ